MSILIYDVTVFHDNITLYLNMYNCQKVSQGYTRSLAISEPHSVTDHYHCRLILVIAVGHSTPSNTLYLNLVVVLCMGMSLQYGSNVCLCLHCYYRWYVVLQAIILCYNTIGLYITNNNQQMRRKGNEVCPSFLSQLSHLLSLTHSLSYIVSSLVRTWVSWKCLDFDIRHAQGQRLNRCEVREREKSERTKGEGEMSTLFPSFLTPHFNLILKVSIG